MAEVESKLVTISKDAHKELIKRSDMLHALIQVGLKHWAHYQEALDLVGNQVPANMPAYEPEPIVERGPPVEPTAEEIAELQQEGGIAMVPPPDQPPPV